MKLIICFLVAVQFSGCARGGGGGGKGSKHDLFKIHVPEFIKHQYHTHYVFIHDHAPKKSHKKPEIKHHHQKHSGHSHHHKHSFGIHSLLGPHMTKHGQPMVKHIMVVHKIPHHHIVSHKAPTHIPPTHKHKTTPKSHKPKEQHQPTYPFTHEDVRYSASPASSGYQVTEDYDPEDAVLNGFHPDDYSIPGELSDPPIEGEHHTVGDYPTQAEESPKPYPGFFTYPNSHTAGTYGNYGSPGLSSYDISPYHQVDSQEKNQQAPKTYYGIENTNAAEEISPYTAGFSTLPYQEDDFRGDHDFNYEHQSDGFPFQQSGYDNLSHEGHESDEFGEIVPSYTQHHKKFVNDVNQGIQTTAYDDRVHKYTADDTGDKQAQTVGFQHSFSHGGLYTSHV